MAETSIEWTDFSINPIRARDPKTGAVGHYCEKVSSGCAHCYASTLQKRFRMPPFPGKPREPSTSVLERDVIKIRGLVVFLDESKLQEVLRRRKPTKWFWCDMSDMFGSWVPFSWIDRCFDVMAQTPQHIHQVLTKRPERAATFLESRAVNAPLPNVWLGTSVENQQTADERIPHLLKCKAAVRFLSAEPLLGPINLRAAGAMMSTTCSCSEPWATRVCKDERCHDTGTVGAIDWLIVGGESGHGARFCYLDAVGSIIRQCRSAGIPVFNKQAGSDPVVDYYSDDECLREWALSGRYEIWEPAGRGEWYIRTDTDRYQPAPGTIIRVRLHDKKGGDPAEWPEDLKIRQFPPSLEPVCL